MNFLFIFIVLFLVVMYVFIYRQNKRRRENQLSSVEEFRKNYINRREEMQKRRETAQMHSNYLTKYNSGEDYRYRENDSGTE